ncbi:hypothetical protein RvY_00971 [Ramazzottius varieornatus]|uniref:Nose resistant-to-fluoxetine protein N-terminal domain-containing protein n=1 Tax=Ramazzottius varieornatus TaxID=947166 RepID=A0A1D1UFK8_RAMVA|nr:hypothetical protein RvY_00971 [Ramazzottius varieornatus]
MRRSVVLPSLGLLLLACSTNALNSAFDKETLGMQVMLTNWNSNESIHTLITEIENQIPMNTSRECKTAVHQWVFDLMMKKPYSLKMVDAFGKLPSGVGLGHILIFGDFDQCLGVRNVTGTGEPVSNYCLARMRHPGVARAGLPVLPAYGVCLPLACANQNDTNAFVTGLFRPLKAAEELEAINSVCVFKVARDAGFYVMVAIISLILATVAAAIVVDLIYRRRYEEGNHAVLNGTDQSLELPQVTGTKVVSHGNGTTLTTHNFESKQVITKSKYGYANVPMFLKPLLCWNFMTNLRSIFASGNEGDISFLHGFRVLSMWWIILGHTYYFGRNFFENTLTFYGDVRTAMFQIVLNAGYAVDSFFLLSGLLISYVLLRDLQKNNGRLNWALVYFHRWWRLTPVYLYVMMMYVYILPHGFQSPFKLLIAQEGAPTEYCKSYWWSNMLYINNFFPLFKKIQCMNWTWFLALDMQFFLITPILVFILYKSRVAGMAIIGVIITACIATTMGIIGYYGLPIHFWQEEYYNATETGYHKDIDYIYEKPYTRITPFVIGVLLGYIFVTKEAHKFAGNSRLMGLVGWAVCTAIAIPLIFGFHFNEWYIEKPPQRMTIGGRVVYGGIQRLGWSLVVGWVLFACQYGYAGPVRRFLGSRFWRPLSNLTYGAYLVHMLTLQLYFASQRHMVYYSPLNMTAIFLSQLVLAYLVALKLAVFIEVPLLRLERLLIRKSL